jgi:hypothetical protein
MALWRAHPLCYFELTTMLPRGVGSLKSEIPEIPEVDIARGRHKGRAGVIFVLGLNLSSKIPVSMTKLVGKASWPAIYNPTV